jgi:hypothetical protein
MGNFYKKLRGNMSAKSYLRKSKIHEDEMTKATVEGTSRGQKIRSGLVFKLIIGIGLLAIIGTIAIPNPKDQLKDEIREIENSSPDRINSDQLAKILNNQNPALNDQTQTIASAIQGKIVEWELEILVVASLPDHFKILTKPTVNHPGTLLTLYPQNNPQIMYLKNVQPGTSIKIKGKIAGILQGRIRINPTLLI